MVWSKLADRRRVDGPCRPGVGNVLYALGARSAAEICSFPAGGVVESPAAASGLVCGGSWDRGVYAFDLTP